MFGPPLPSIEAPDGKDVFDYPMNKDEMYTFLGSLEPGGRWKNEDLEHPSGQERVTFDDGFNRVVYGNPIKVGGGGFGIVYTFKILKEPENYFKSTLYYFHVRDSNRLVRLIPRKIAVKISYGIEAAIVEKDGVEAFNNVWKHVKSEFHPVRFRLFWLGQKRFGLTFMPVFSDSLQGIIFTFDDGGMSVLGIVQRLIEQFNLLRRFNVYVCDIKPPNVLVGYGSHDDPKQISVMLSDFGGFIDLKKTTPPMHVTYPLRGRSEPSERLAVWSFGLILLFSALENRAEQEIFHNLFRSDKTPQSDMEEFFKPIVHRLNTADYQKASQLAVEMSRNVLSENETTGCSLMALCILYALSDPERGEQPTLEVLHQIIKSDDEVYKRRRLSG